MKKLICLWLDHTYRIDDFDEKKGFLFNNLCLNLSSEFIVKSKKRGSSIVFFVEKNNRYQSSFYSNNITDVKVLVGNNGTGKTTILKQIFSIISNPVNIQRGKYALIYEEDKRIFVYSAKSIKVEIEIITKGYEVCYEENFLQKDLALFFTPEFKGDANDYFYSDFRNISTDGYLYRAKSELKEIQNNASEYSNQKDSILYYKENESNRIIDFMLNAGNYFFQVFPVPRKMLMKVNYANVEAGIERAAEMILDTNESVESLIKIFPRLNDDDLLNKRLADDDFLSENDKKLFGEEIKSYLLNCYNDFCDNVEDKFLFAGMICCIRTYWFKRPEISKSLNFNINWKKLRREPRDVIEEFFKSNCKNGIGKFGRSLNDILTKTGKNEKKDDFIVFDLQYRKYSLREVRDIYNAMYYLYPPFSFSFTRALSSGEKQFICLYSRLYDCLKQAARTGYSLESIYLLIDEADVFMHPEWQRKWFKTFVELVKDIEYRLKKLRKEPNNAKGPKCLKGSLKVQLIVATHSPFMLTDCLNDNVLKLKRTENFGRVQCLKDNSKPLAGNILDILQSGFFLNGTMGELIEKKIDDLIERIHNKEKLDKKNASILENIGNPILKSLLKRCNSSRG